MKASFGANISRMNNPSTVWMDDATYKDVSGSATMTATETNVAVTSSLSSRYCIQKNKLSPTHKVSCNSKCVYWQSCGASLKTYNNSKVRQGQKVTNAKSHAQGLLHG